AHSPRVRTSTRSSEPPPSVRSSSQRGRISCSTGVSPASGWRTRASPRPRSKRGSAAWRRLTATSWLAWRGLVRRNELAALGELASAAAASTAGQIYEMHKAIADRVWRAVGPAALPVRFAHDRIARGAYSVAREVTRSVVRAGAGAVSESRSGDGASIEVTVTGRTVVGALNGI